jgi:hypothetical protein
MNLDMLAELIASEIPPDATDGELARRTRNMLTSFANDLTTTDTVGGVAVRVRRLHESQASPPGRVNPEELMASESEGGSPLGRAPTPGPSATNGHSTVTRLTPYAQDIEALDRGMSMEAYEIYRRRFGLDVRREGILDA